MIQNGYMRMNEAIAPDLNMMTNENARSNVSTFLNPCGLTDKFRCFHERTEMPYDLLVSLERLRVDQQCFTGRNICFFVNDDKCGSRMKTFIIILRMVYKNHIP